MELLKFSDSPKSARRGKNPAAFIGAGIMVAVMGLSSTLAGTITIGTGTVEFGQGIVNTAACDNSIVVTPASTYDYAANEFRVSSITVSDIGFTDAGATNASGRGCKENVLELRAYNSSGTLLPFYSDTATTEALTFYVPADTVVATSFAKGMYDTTDGATSGNKVASPTLVVNSGTTADEADATGASALSVTLGGLKLSSEVVRLTVESRAARATGGESTP